jgi:hypothetical protein
VADSLIQDKEVQALLAECLLDTRKFGSAFMPKRFFRPWIDIHDEFFSYLDGDSPFTVIAAPRGFGKTTIDSIAYPAKNIVFQESNFVELVSCTHSVAAQNVKNLGRELLGNKMIKKFFGGLKGPIWSEGKGHLETSTGITVLARGAGQQIRGLLEGDSRPDLVIIDDLEDPEPFRLGDPTEYLRKIKEWFWSDLMNSLDARPGTRVIYVGTILHEDSLLQNLLDDPDWNSVRLELCDDNYESNFPALMSTEKVKKLAKAFEARGMLDVFYREYRNLAVAAATASFKKEFFKYWDPSYDPIGDMEVDRVVIIDPAKTTNLHSAYSAVCGWGFSSQRNKMFQMDCVNERFHPEELYRAILSMAQRLRTSTIAVEVTSLNEFITYPLNTYLSSEGYPPVIELKARANKLERIKQLAPLYRMGSILHHPNENIHGPLEAQLLTFPRSKYLDVADCTAYMIELFALGERFFGLPDHEDERALEEEIAAMDAMDNAATPLGNWRWAP